MKPSIELMTEATKVFGRLRRGEITREQLEEELRVLEGDEIDRGWNDYNDHREAIGGGNAY